MTVVKGTLQQSQLLVLQVVFPMRIATLHHPDAMGNLRETLSQPFKQHEMPFSLLIQLRIPLHKARRLKRKIQGSHITAIQQNLE